MFDINKTSFLKVSEIKKKWLMVDAKNCTLGRLASRVAMILRGKNKSVYTPHMDCGDNIVVINTKFINLTGNKIHNKLYYKHSGYPGGLSTKKAIDIMKGKNPEKLLLLAVKRMMPKESPLARKQLKNLYIYHNDTHKHEAQKPYLINIKHY